MSDETPYAGPVQDRSSESLSEIRLHVSLLDAQVAAMQSALAASLNEQGDHKIVPLLPGLPEVGGGGSQSIRGEPQLYQVASARYWTPTGTLVDVDTSPSEADVLYPTWDYVRVAE